MTARSGTLGDTPSGGGGVAWELTARISPRRVVRAAALDADGRPLNSYPLLHPVAGCRPLTPWAVHLTDGEGRFHLLCADLDAKTSPDAAARDAHTFAGLLDELAVPHVVCASGPTGGRHVWIGLAESIDAELVAAFAHLLKAWLPSLDVAPLVNPASGCVRPPGSPHRLGGTSRTLAGSASSLTDPSVTAEQVRALVGRLADEVTVAGPAVRSGRRPVAEDRGLAYLPGRRRALSASCRALVDAVPAGDLSAVLWRILCGAAVAHWRYADVETLIQAPGLEHVRTLRTGATRTPRPVTGPSSPTVVLRRQWTRAVEAMAAASPAATQLGEDATFEARAELTTAVIRAAQGLADATPSRWGSTRAGLAQRRVLDAVCLFHLQAVRHDEVEADIRRLALTCGIDRETARRSLLALAADGWVTRTHPASGRRGARWSVDPSGELHRRMTGLLSQADPRPGDIGPALRIVLARELTDRLRADAHDAFAPTGGLGLAAGSLYGRLSEPEGTLGGARLMGWTVDQATLVLERLASNGLIERRAGGWQRTDPEHLDRVAVEQGTQGRHQQRADRYALERAAWAWWHDELAWMRAPRPSCTPTTRHRGAQPAADRAGWPSHPRHRNGRGDYAAARRTLGIRHGGGAREGQGTCVRPGSTDALHGGTGGLLRRLGSLE